MLNTILVGLGGGLGALARYSTGVYIQDKIESKIPLHPLPPIIRHTMTIIIVILLKFLIILYLTLSLSEKLCPLSPHLLAPVPLIRPPLCKRNHSSAPYQTPPQKTSQSNCKIYHFSISDFLINDPEFNFSFTSLFSNKKTNLILRIT